jgi:hypothetical protein
MAPGSGRRAPSEGARIVRCWKHNDFICARLNPATWKRTLRSAQGRRSRGSCPVESQVRQEASRPAEGQITQALAAREGFKRGRETLGRVASVEQQARHDRRIPWAVGGGAALAGAALGMMLFMEINRHAPDGCRW